MKDTGNDDNFMFRINDLRLFKKDIKEQVLNKFKTKLSKYLPDEEEDVTSLLNKIKLKGDYITPNILNYEIEKFVVIDEYNKNKGFINKNDIPRLVTSLTNEIICRHLNLLVDTGIMDMCWDSEKYEFIWRPKRKE